MVGSPGSGLLDCGRNAAHELRADGGRGQGPAGGRGDGGEDTLEHGDGYGVCVVMEDSGFEGLWCCCKGEIVGYVDVIV